MNQTPNYALNQWEASDRVQRADFNADNAKIDAALGTLAEEKGNCRIVTGSYVGTGEFGQDHPNTLTFPRKPLIIFLATNYCNNYNSAMEYHILARNMPRLAGHGTNNLNTLIWTEHGVSWHIGYLLDATNSAKYQYNELGKTYEYIALLI